MTVEIITENAFSRTISVTNNWFPFILCKGTEGNCSGNFTLTSSLEDLKVGQLGAPVPGVVGFKSFDGEKKDGSRSVEIKCEGPCPPKEPKKTANLKTFFNALVGNPNPAIGISPPITGTLTLTITPDKAENNCPDENEEGWTMILEIDSKEGKSDRKTKILNAIDINKSDYDGDKVSNEKENLDGDKKFSDHDTDEDGIPNFLDTDDDGDGKLTANEDPDGDGDPTNDDVNMNGIPNYLDKDE